MDLCRCRTVVLTNSIAAYNATGYMILTRTISRGDMLLLYLSISALACKVLRPISLDSDVYSVLGVRMNNKLLSIF